MRHAFLFLLLFFGCSTPPPVLVQNTNTKPAIISPAETETAIIRINFVLYQSQLDEYPEIYDVFIDALKEWSRVVPIEAMVMVSPPKQQRGSVAISLMPNLDAYNRDKTNMLGLWSKATRTVMLDMGDFYGTTKTLDKPYALTIIMHELGHVFGLPHVADTGTMMVPGGDIIVKSKAETMLMYPAMNPRNIGVGPSKIEIEYARLYILTRLSDDLQ